MYKVEHLPVARDDLADIARYIAQELKDPAAAVRVASSIVEEIAAAAGMPYAQPLYTPIRPLEREYRKLVMAQSNYMAFYWVDEQAKRMTVARVVYARSDYEKRLDQGARHSAQKAHKFSKTSIFSCFSRQSVVYLKSSKT